MVFWPVSVSGSAVALLIVDRNSSEKAILPWNSPGSSRSRRMKKKKEESEDQEEAAERWNGGTGLQGCSKL